MRIQSQSEIQPESELHQARSAGQAGDSSEIRAVDVGFGIAEINRIKEVKDFAPELNIQIFA